jgi:hypothetical protein
VNWTHADQGRGTDKGQPFLSRSIHGAAMKHYLRDLMLCALGISVATVTGASENSVMPLDLVQAAAVERCSQISDFYERPGPIDPPYLYGFEGDANPNGAIFWCRNGNASAAAKFKLVFVGSPKIATSCPHELDWWNMPGGLSIESARDVKLSSLRYVSDPKKKGPIGVARLSGVKSSYDGVEGIFYCFKGQWLYVLRH